MASRSELVDAARDLNKELDLSPPIDVTAAGAKIRERLAHDFADLGLESDYFKLKAKTLAVCFEAAGRALPDVAQDRLAAAAADLNRVLALEPEIEAGSDLLAIEVMQAGTLLAEDDAVSAETCAVLAELLGRATGSADAAPAEENAEPDAMTQEDVPADQSAAPASDGDPAPKRGRGRPRKDATVIKDAAEAEPKKSAAAPKKAVRGVRTAAEPKARKPRERANPVIGEFKPVRAGTKYEELLKMADAGRKVDDIAKKYGVTRTDVLWFFRYPLRKSHGIDHVVADDGTIRLVLPKGKGLGDCVVARQAA